MASKQRWAQHPQSAAELPYPPMSPPIPELLLRVTRGCKAPGPAGQHLRLSVAWPLPLEVPVSSVSGFRREPPASQIDGSTWYCREDQFWHSHTISLGFLFHRGGKEEGAPGISRKGLEKGFLSSGEKDEAFFFFMRKRCLKRRQGR